MDSLEDIRATRQLFDETCTSLGVGKPPAFGAMIETPAAALGISAIARHVDFLSVGTNDLTQYTFATRDDPNVNQYFQDARASLLRLLEIIVHDAGDVPLTICGELAGREELLPRLIAIGFRFQRRSAADPSDEGSRPQSPHRFPVLTAESDPIRLVPMPARCGCERPQTAISWT